MLSSRDWINALFAEKYPPMNESIKILAFDRDFPVEGFCYSG